MNIGMARTPLHWALGLPLAGYGSRTAPANGYHRETFVRAMIVSSADDSQRVCLISAEVLCIDAALTDRLRHDVYQATGIPAHAVMIATTHTHASVKGLTHFPVPTKTDAIFGKFSPDMVDHVAKVVVSTVQRALEGQVEGSLWTGTGLTHAIAANRRDPHEVADPRVPLLIAKNTHGHIIGAILNFACHPTVLSAANLLYSGDLIGTACAHLEEQANWPIVLGLTGAAGNISTRFTRRESTTAEVERLAQALAEAALAASLQPVAEAMISAAQEVIQLPVKAIPPAEVLLPKLAEAQARLAHTPAGPSRRIVETEVEGIEYQLKMGERPTHLRAEVQVLRLGDAYIIALPGEYFVEYGLELTHTLAPAPVLIAGYANDYVGYVTTPAATDGYEADTAIVEASAGQLTVEAAMRAVQHLASAK